MTRHRDALAQALCICQARRPNFRPQRAVERSGQPVHVAFVPSQASTPVPPTSFQPPASEAGAFSPTTVPFVYPNLHGVVPDETWKTSAVVVRITTTFADPSSPRACTETSTPNQAVTDFAEAMATVAFDTVPTQAPVHRKKRGLQLRIYLKKYILF